MLLLTVPVDDKVFVVAFKLFHVVAFKLFHVKLKVTSARVTRGEGRAVPCTRDHINGVLQK